MLLISLTRKHHRHPGSLRAGRRLRHDERGTVLADKELVVNVLGEQRLRPHVPAR